MLGHKISHCNGLKNFAIEYFHENAKCRVLLIRGPDRAFEATKNRGRTLSDTVKGQSSEIFYLQLFEFSVRKSDLPGYHTPASHTPLGIIPR